MNENNVLSPHTYSFLPISRSDGEEIIEIFNYYICNSSATFLEEPVPTSFFDLIVSHLGSYPSVTVRDSYGYLIGFGMIRPHNPLPVFRHTAEITSFIRPEKTGFGIGRQMLTYLINEAKKRDIWFLLAQISSSNERSIRFHTQNGFRECGRFIHAGCRKGNFFDIVWMEKEIK
jgi:phosphinothricin acetyltransferase